MRILQNALAFFQSLPNVHKAMIIIIALVVAILASRAFYVIALLVFMVGIVALIVQAVRRRPLKQWGIVTGSALVLTIIFAGLSGGTPAPREQASKEEDIVAEVTADEPTEEEPAAVEEEPASDVEAKAESEPEPAPSKEKEEPKEESIAGIGEVVEVDEGIWIVTNADQASQLADQFGGFMPPKQGNFVIVDFRFKNDANEAKTLSTMAIKLIDKDGRESDPDTDTFSYIPQDKDIFLEQVNPGVTEDGRVIFSVSPDASGFKLQLRGTSMFSLEEPKEVALGF